MSHGGVFREGFLPAVLPANIRPIRGQGGTSLKDIWLSYADAAERLGIKPDSVRRTARAKSWPRRTMNDGTVQVAVPAERLPDAPPDAPPDNPPQKSAPSNIESAIEIARLEERLHAARELIEELRSQRDVWQAKAMANDLSPPRDEGLLARIRRSLTGR